MMGKENKIVNPIQNMFEKYEYKNGASTKESNQIAKYWNEIV